MARGRIERPSVVKRGRPLAPAAPYLPNRNCTGAAGRHPGGAAFTGPAYVEKEAGAMPNTGGGSLWIRTRTSGREPPRRTISARLPYSTLSILWSAPKTCHPEPKAKDLKHSPPRYTRQNKTTIFFTSIGINYCLFDQSDPCNRKSISCIVKRLTAHNPGPGPRRGPCYPPRRS